MPKISCEFNEIVYFKSKRFHRKKGPAIEYRNVYKQWYKKGKLHREDGPACEFPDGDIEFWFNDVWLTEKEFLKRTKNA